MAAAEPVFRFAHLSDPHLTDPSAASAAELMGKRALGYLSWLRRRRHEHRREILDALVRDISTRAPHHTVVTGDLTHISLPDEFAQARDWLSALGTPDRVTVIPGNHDAYVNAPWEHSQGLWADYMSGDAGRATSRDDFPFVRIRGPVAFVGVDSAVPAPVLLATGRLGEAQTSRLADTLVTLRESGLLRVLLIHHPPVPGTEKWRKRLTDGPALCRLMEKEPVDLVLHGHQHRPRESAIPVPGGAIPVFGIPSASAAGLHGGHGSSYNEYDVYRQERGFRVEVKARTRCSITGTYGEASLGSLETAGRSRSITASTCA